MARHVQNGTLTLTGASQRLLEARTAGLRISFYITQLGANQLTIAKGETAAVANGGIVIQQNSTLFEVSGDRLRCWQGAIQVIGTAAQTVAYSEEWED